MTPRSMSEPLIRRPTAISWLTSVRWRAPVTSGVSVITFILLWQLASTREATVLFPGPVATVHTLVTLLHDGILSRDVLISLMRIGIGFALGVLVGVPLGLAMGTFRPIKIFFEPCVQFLRFVPAIAWLVPAILWFGIGEQSKVFLIFYTTIFLVMLNTMIGATAERRNQIRAAQCFGASWWQLYAWVVFPATISGHHEALRSSVPDGRLSANHRRKMMSRDSVAGAISLRNADFQFAPGSPLVLKGFTLDIRPGEFFVLLGLRGLELKLQLIGCSALLLTYSRSRIFQRPGSG